MSSKKTWLALVALSEPYLPSAEKLIECIENTWPNSPVPQLVSTTEGMITFECGEAIIGCTLIPEPISAEQLEGPCSTAWYWPDAASAFQNHSAHLLITLVSEKRNTIDKSTRLTEMVTAAALDSRASGIFWGQSAMVHEPMSFYDQATQMAADNLPLYLWVDFRLQESETGQFSLFTTGLEAFGNMEIEIANYNGDPQTLMNHVYNLAHYQLEKQADLKDGDTISLTDEVQATISYQKSMLDDEKEVVSLTID